MRIFLERVAADCRIRNRNGLLGFIHLFYRYVGFRVVFFYRLQQSTYTLGFSRISFLISRRILRKYGSDFSRGCEFEGGLLINHPSGIVIGSQVVAGSNVQLMSGVVLGQKSFKPRILLDDGNPSLGNNVNIGANSVLIGKIYIGSNSDIGALSFVNFDVPENCICVGNPAVILSKTFPNE